MKKFYRSIIFTLLFVLLSTSIISAASGNYGPNKSLSWKDEVTWIPMKKVRMETWDPQGRTTIRWQSEACLGATQGASTEYCTVSKTGTGREQAIAIRERLLGGTAYTYAYWAYN